MRGPLLSPQARFRLPLDYSPPTFRVPGFLVLGLVGLLPHQSGCGFPEFLLFFWVCLADQAAYFTRKPFYLLFSFLLIGSHLLVNSFFVYCRECQSPLQRSLHRRKMARKQMG